MIPLCVYICTHTLVCYMHEYICVCVHVLGKLCVYIHMWMCVHICTQHENVYVWHVWLYTNPFSCVCTGLHICIGIGTHAYRSICVYILVFVCTNDAVCVHVCVGTSWIHVCICVCVCIIILMHTWRDDFLRWQNCQVGYISQYV